MQLQQEHALAARSQQLQALMDLKSQATVPTLAAEVIAGNPDPVMRTVTIDRGSADGVHGRHGGDRAGRRSSGASSGRSRGTRRACS